MENWSPRRSARAGGARRQLRASRPLHLYGLAGDALRGSTPDDGFSIRIFERMKREGVKIEPGYDPLED